MPITPDHRPGVINYEDIGIVLSDAGSAAPTQAGSVAYANALFALSDAAGTYNPRTVYQLTHTALADLIHYLDDGPAITGAYKLITYVNTSFIKTITWYTSSAATAKIVDRTLTYPSGSFATVTLDVWRIYGPDGATVLHTVSDSIVNSGILEVSRTRTYS